MEDVRAVEEVQGAHQVVEDRCRVVQGETALLQHSEHAPEVVRVVVHDNKNFWKILLPIG